MIQSMLMIKLSPPRICVPALHMTSQVHCTAVVISVTCIYSQCLIVVVQNVKSDDGNYEDIPSNTHEGNEPIYTGVA